MYVNTNLNSQIAQSNLFKNSKEVSQAMERLSSGLRINNASDDAAGLAISERMTAQVNGMNQSLRNAQDGISLAQSAEGAMGTVTDMLQRMRTLAVQADNGTYSEDDLEAVQSEMDNLVAEINHIVGETHFNGIDLLGGDDGGDLAIKIHISDKSDDTIDINIADLSELMVDGDVDVTEDAQAAIDAIDTALGEVNDARAELGSVQNRLDFISDNLHTNVNNTDAAKMRILDADMAEEMSALTKSEILQNTTLAMLPRANSQPQAIMQLLNS